MKTKSLELPFMLRKGALAAPAAPNNLLGLCSIQDFSGSLGNHNSDLSQTHADARGFYTYLYNWYTANFWFTDGAVKTWLYEEPYDHWQNYYGVDAVDIFYHSGHGAMDANGVFEAPTGGIWNNESWVFSNHNMSLANQKARYIFWSTCFSCRVADGQSPIKTWWNDDNNPGFRMLFGFETTSVDSGDYGKNFWNHWKNNESFSTAWLNASWDISHGQAPSVVASGANQTEASNILYNERLIQWATVARNWYQWRWYFAASMVARNKSLPKELMIAEFAPMSFDQKKFDKLADDLEFSQKSRAGLSLSPDGNYTMNDKLKTISVQQNGQLNAKLAAINYQNTKTIEESKARDIAEKFIKEHSLSKSIDIQFDMIRLGKTCGGSTKKGELDKEVVTDTTIQFKQIINGIPSVNNDQGVIRITVDNDGKVTDMHHSLKEIAHLTNKPKGLAIDPTHETNLAALGNGMLEKGFNEKLHAYKKATLLENSSEIGYDLSKMHGIIVAKREYEVEFENNLKKRIQIIEPIFH